MFEKLGQHEKDKMQHLTFKKEGAVVAFCMTLSMEESVKAGWDSEFSNAFLRRIVCKYLKDFYICVFFWSIKLFKHRATCGLLSKCHLLRPSQAT